MMSGIKHLLWAGASVVMSTGVVTAQGVCSMQNIQGTYVNVVSIYAGTVPMASIGLTKIEATGHWVGPVTIVTPFGPMELASEGEIEVEPDCTATITQHAGGYDHIWTAVILNNGEEIRSVHTDPAIEPLPTGATPTVRIQDLVRLSAGPRNVNTCSAAKLVGRYAKTCTGWTRTGPGTYLPFATIARIESSGDETGSGNGVQVSAGQKIPFEYKALAFSVDASCLGTASYQLSGDPMSERFALFDEWKQMVSVILSADQVGICWSVRMDR
jgi:hypothetical protein